MKYLMPIVLSMICVESASATCVSPSTSPNSWATTTTAEYRACILAEERKAERDINYAARHPDRIINNLIWDSSINEGLNLLKINKIPFLKDYLSGLTEADYLSEATQRGINNRFAEFEQAYNQVQNNESATIANATSLASSWKELEKQLLGSLTENSTKAERELVARLVTQGQLAVDQASMQTVLKQSGLEREEARRFVELKFAKYDGALQAINDQLSIVSKEALSAREYKHQAQIIAEYSALAGTFVEVGHHVGVFSSQDSARALKVMDGISKLATASAMFKQQAGYASLAGPYGLAFAGMLSISSAFADSGPSETEQILSALQSLSEQVAELQFTVETGFSSLSTQISESEVRIMGRLADILDSNAAISTKLSSMSSELSTLREEWLVARRLEQYTDMSAFWREISYEDRFCLKAFDGQEVEQRRRCLETYAELIKSFEIEKNALFTGALIPAHRYQIPYNDRFSHVVNSAEKYGIDFGDLEPVHLPTLERIVSRLNLFWAYNPDIPSSSLLFRLIEDVDQKGQQVSAISEVLGSKGSAQEINENYLREINSIFDQLEKNERAYGITREVNVGDEIHNYEQLNANRSSSLRSTAKQFSANGGLLGRSDRIYRLVRQAPDASSSIEPLESGRPHKLISDKLQNIAEIASQKDTISTLSYADATTGYHWVTPCNAQSGYPSFPVSRQFLSRTLPTDLIAAGIGDKSTLRLCFKVISTKNRGNIGIGNTDTGMGVVKSRLQNIDLPYGPIRISNRFRYPFCEGARPHFKDVYGRFSEYSKSDWEKCHKGHIHHKLYVNTEQAGGYIFEFSINLPSFQGSFNTFTHEITLPNAQLDKCFFPFDRKNKANKNSILMPYFQQYPLPISKACDGVDNAFIKALTAVGPQITEFVRNQTVVPTDGGDKVPLTDALKAVKQNNSFSNRRNFVDQLIKDIDFSKLNELADLVFVSNDLSPDGVEEHWGYWPDEIEFKRFMETVIFSGDDGGVSTISEARHTFAGYQAPIER